MHPQSLIVGILSFENHINGYRDFQKNNLMNNTY